MSIYCGSLSSQRGQIIEGPANHIKAFGPDPDGSVEGFKRGTGQRSAEHSRVLRQLSTQQPCERGVVMPILPKETRA